MLLLAWRRMSSSKWMILCLLVGSIMATAIVSCIPIYTDGMLQRMLTKDLENYQSDSGIYPGTYNISANLPYIDSYDARLKAFRYYDETINGTLAGNFKIPVLTSEREVTSDQLILNNTNLRGAAIERYLEFGAIDTLEEHIRITNGRMYAKQSADGVYETIMTSAAMHDFNLLLNQEYELYSPLSEQKYKVKVVGVFTVKDSSDTFWYKPLSKYNKFYMDYTVFKEEFIVKNRALISGAQWFYAFDYSKLAIYRMSDFLTEYDAQENWIKGYESILTMSMPAMPILEKYVERSLQLKSILWMLIIPVLIMLVFYIFMVSQLIVQHDENGIAVLKSRGAGKLQIFISYLIESLMIGAVAMAAGPPLGMALCRVLGASNGFLEFVERAALPLKLKNTAFIYSSMAMMLFIITMLIPVFLASRTSIVSYKQNMSKKKKSPIWMVFLNILILASSGYGIYRYDQQQKILSDTGINASELHIDPLLFLSSTLFILGAGLLFLQIYPYLIRLIHWLGKKFWTPVVYASLVQVGRSKGREQFLMLFIILAISSGIYSANSARTINRNIEDKIKYKAGADVTLTAVWENDQNKKSTTGSEAADTSDSSTAVDAADTANEKPLRYFEPDYTRFSTLSGVEQATKVLSIDKMSAQFGEQIIPNIKLMGIIPHEFAKIAWFRNNLLTYHWYQYLNMMTDAPQAVLLSSNLKEKMNLKLGDLIYMSWGENRITGIVYAFIDYWPTYNPNPATRKDEAPSLIVANYNYISNKLPIQPYEVWIKKQAGASDKQINDDILTRNLEIEKITYTNQELIKAKNDPMLQGINGSLTLGFIAAMLISTLGFLIYWILSIRSRLLYFAILRSLGLSKAKVTGAIFCEQVLVSGAAIVMGFVIGGITSDLFIPMLQIVYSSAEQVPPFKIIADAGDYLKIYAVVALMLLIGFCILGRIITKLKIAQAMKMGED